MSFFFFLDFGLFLLGGLAIKSILNRLYHNDDNRYLEYIPRTYSPNQNSEIPPRYDHNNVPVEFSRDSLSPIEQNQDAVSIDSDKPPSYSSIIN